MTLEDAKKLFKEDLDSYGKPKKIMSKLKQIFKEFELEKEMIIFEYESKCSKLKGDR